MINIPKGKKFNAAEKHFQEKEKQYQNEIKRLKQYITENKIDRHKYEEQISELQTENNQLKDWVNRLLEYTELDKEDIKSACEKDKGISELMKMLGMFSKGLF